MRRCARQRGMKWTLLFSNLVFPYFMQCIKSKCDLRSEQCSHRVIIQWIVRDSSVVRWLFVRLVGAMEHQSALHKEINSRPSHFHVSWLLDFILYPKPLYNSLHQSFFYSFITILLSESGVTLDYCTIFP